MKNLLAKTLISFTLATTIMADSIPEFELTFNDGIITPQTLKIPAEAKFKLIVKNIGTVAEEFESAVLNREKLIAPGKKAVIFLGPLKKNSYSFIAEFHADKKSAHGTIVAE